MTWTDSSDVRNLARGELLPARYSLDQVMKLELLRRVLEWKVGVDSGWSTPVGVLGRRFERLLDSQTWHELETTYVGPEPEENWRALFATMELFARVARQVGDALSIEYPERLHREVTGRLSALEDA